MTGADTKIVDSMSKQLKDMNDERSKVTTGMVPNP